MKEELKVTRLIFFLLLGIFMLKIQIILAQEESISFDSDRWDLKNGRVVDYLNRKCLLGNAELKEVEFSNGIIEVDIAMNGRPSYPGIGFRIQSDNNYEHIYFRPHRAGLYPDALQYTPVFNGISGWQLYHGDGFTSALSIPKDQWVHLKVEVSGSQARIFVNDSEQPVLQVYELKHGFGKGKIGIFNSMDGSSYISNFRYKIANSLPFDPPPFQDIKPGLIREWQISQPLEASEIDPEQYPGQEFQDKIEWQTVHSEPTGLVDVAKFVQAPLPQTSCIYGKVNLESKKDEIKKIRFGYSDLIGIYLNKQIIFSGNSAYRLRDPSFLGIIGLNDIVYLPLKKGPNELFFILAESFGGWGFQFQDGWAVYLDENLTKLWESQKLFKIPESIAYDPKRNTYYISNYDVYNRSTTEGLQSISKMNREGKVESQNWVGGLFNPTGLTVHNDRLFLVERTNVVEIDLDTGLIQNRIPIPQPGFLNDLTIDNRGNIYVSDSRKNLLLKISDGVVEEWLREPQVGSPNGLCIYKNSLIVGNNSDQSIKAINLATKKIERVIKLGQGIIDGIKADGNGNLLVSHWEGKIYKITPANQITKILDTSVIECNCADFDFIPEDKTIVIPTFFENKVIAYQFK